MMKNEKNVFVVYGRNKWAKDAVFSFLRALKVEPIEWSQAISLTGKSSPSTIEVVKAGIEAAQCVVVIFTGDDLAKLKPGFGNEAVMPQPRPNVLFEAGWAFGVAGQDKTILLAFEDFRKISDLDGVTYVAIDNSAPRRKEFIERLKSAGVKLDDSITDIYRPEVAGDFDLTGKTESSDEQKFNLGGFTEFIADATLNHSPDLLESHKELCSYINNQGGRLDLKNHYSGSFCASNWINLSEDPGYGHSELINHIANNLGEILDRCNFEPKEKVDFISLGCGDGKIDKKILYQLQGLNEVACYFPLDFSLELLQRAVSEIIKTTWLFNPSHPFKIKAIHGDFNNLIRYKPVYSFEPGRNLFSLVGYTFGNYIESELIGKIYEGMEIGDLLLVDARLHDSDKSDFRKLSTDDKEKMLFNYRSALNNQFAFGPIEAVTTAEHRTTKFEYRIDNSLTVVPNAINVITYCENLTTKFRHNFKTIKRKKIDLAFTTFYNFTSLENWFRDKEFFVLWSKKISSTGIFLLKKY